MSGELTVRQVRAWQRRLSAMERAATDMMSQAVDLVGHDFQIAGENLTGQLDDVAAGAERVCGYFETVALVLKAKSK